MSAAPAEEDRLDPRAQRSRAALRRALARMLGEMPLEAISCLAVSRRAGVGYATFYRNYQGIDALLADLAGELIEELSILAVAAHARGGREAAEAIARFVDERRVVLRPLFVGASAKLQRDMMEQAMATADQSGAADPALPRSLLVSHRVTATLNLLRWWLEEGEDHPAAEVAGFIDRLAFGASSQRDGL